MMSHFGQLNPTIMPHLFLHASTAWAKLGWGPIHMIVNFHYQPTNAMWAHDLCTFSGCLTEKNVQVRYTIGQFTKRCKALCYVNYYDLIYIYEMQQNSDFFSQSDVQKHSIGSESILASCCISTSIDAKTMQHNVLISVVCWCVCTQPAGYTATACCTLDWPWVIT